MSPEFGSTSHCCAFPRHIAGLQLCNGAAAILKKYPTKIKIIPKKQPPIIPNPPIFNAKIGDEESKFILLFIILFISETEIKL